MSACGAENASQTGPVTVADGARTPTTTAPASAGTPSEAPPAATGTAATPPSTAPAPAATPPAPTGGAAPGGTDGGATAGDPAAPGGDERGNRVPAAFTVTASAITPSTITVPPFLALELRLTSGDATGHTVTLRVAPPVSVPVPGSGLTTKRVDGLQEGSYVVEVDGGAATATLRVADDAVGP